MQNPEENSTHVHQCFYVQATSMWRTRHHTAPATGMLQFLVDYSPLRQELLFFRKKDYTRKCINIHIIINIMLISSNRYTLHANSLQLHYIWLELVIVCFIYKYVNNIDMQ